MAYTFMDSNSSEKLSLLQYSSQPAFLPPESSEGNVEYKLKLVNPSKTRFERLVTQMKWRLQEGEGRAIYKIGVEDNGLMVGVTEEEMRDSLQTLNKMAAELGASITLLGMKVIYSGGIRKTAEVLIRKIPDVHLSRELRIVVLGSADAGKSTLLGVLTQGETDNGHGSSRLNIFRHLHEIQSGHTSSISREVMGFDNCGNPLTYRVCRTAEDMCGMADKLVTFIDLAGHPKYNRTTVYGLSSQYSQFAILVVNAFNGMDNITHEHLFLALQLSIPIIIVVNRADQATPTLLTKSLNQIDETLRERRKTMLRITMRNELDGILQRTTRENAVPVFVVSCVTGFGLDMLMLFLNALSSQTTNSQKEELSLLPAEFHINDTFELKFAGTVVAGILTQGSVSEGDELQAGPLDDGSFFPLKVLSLHRHRQACRTIHASESASLGVLLPLSKQVSLRSGMLLVSSGRGHKAPPACRRFEAQMSSFFQLPLTVSFRSTVYIGNVRQCCIVNRIANDLMAFEFLRHPECIQIGAHVILWESTAKSVGKVFTIHKLEPSKENQSSKT